MPYMIQEHNQRKEYVECVEEILKLGRQGVYQNGHQVFSPNKWADVWDTYGQEMTDIYRHFGFSLEVHDYNVYRLVAI